MLSDSAHVGLTPEQLQEIKSEYRARQFMSTLRDDIKQLLAHIDTLTALLAQSQRIGEQAAVDLADAATRTEEQAKRIHELESWIRAANGFMWAHEKTCPRHDADEPCNCGLDQFLGRPRPFVESYRQRIAELEAENAELVTAVNESLRLKQLKETLASVEAERSRLREALSEIEKAFTALTNAARKAQEYNALNVGGKLGPPAVPPIEEQQHLYQVIRRCAALAGKEVSNV